MLPNDYLIDLYDRLHETPMQKKFRRIHPMPCGVVFLQWPEMSYEDIRAEFKLIKKLGFNCLKNLLVRPWMDHKKIEHMAIDEGLSPWWYDDGGWEDITDDLLRQLEIDPALPIDQIRNHPRMQEYQTKVLHARVENPVTSVRSQIMGDDENNFFTFDMRLKHIAVKPFVAWLKQHYKSSDELGLAWNERHRWDALPLDFTSWEALEESMLKAYESPSSVLLREFRLTRDIIRFKADTYLCVMRDGMSKMNAQDPNVPYRAGGEMGLFMPFTSRATDMEGIADVMADFGSFYPSIHLGWHLEEVNFEVTRSIYMMSSLITDWGKGVWCAAWESSGGPQQLSGGKALLFPDAAHATPGFTVNAGVMTQLMLSYLAGGFRGFGFWCWRARTNGWEAGEYALCDRQGRPSDRAIQAGQIALAAQRHRDELWHARKQPLVGILVDFDVAAMWSAWTGLGRDHFKHIPVQSRTGASRAFINANVPWEHVTGTDLRNGLAARYKTIVIPAAYAIPSDLLEILLAYAKQGGRVVLDMPGAALDEFARILNTDTAGTFEQLFGCILRDLQYASNVPRSLNNLPLSGFVADLQPTHGTVVATFDNAQPAIVESRVGEGSAVVLGYEATLSCFAPGNTAFEKLLVTHALGTIQSPYACDNAIAYRLAAPEADHYFLINDGPATSATLNTRALRYTRATDAVTQETLPFNSPIPLPAHSGRWLRLEKSPTTSTK